jgi:hypothetical protein
MKPFRCNWNRIMSYTLGTAAKAAGISKATVHRAIKSGRISATRHDDGSYTIQPAELHRVFPPVSRNSDDNGDVRRSGTPIETAETGKLAVLNAQLEAEIAGLKELVRVHKEQVDDLRTERDRLLGQVESAHRLLTHQTSNTPETPKWFQWFRRSA